MQSEKLTVEPMTVQDVIAEPKRYHHGDLRRALLDAAVAILEREGPAALSLRAVAREAGVSPAAPYHHFKDKSELLYAVGTRGFERLKEAMSEAGSKAKGECKSIRTDIGVAYVEFAQQNPALYSVMYDCARSPEGVHEDGDHDEGAYQLLRDPMAEAAGPEVTDIDLELTVIASWCAAHGLAEMSGFAKFQALKDTLGGERQFIVAVLDHLGLYRHPSAD
jgi:AcrR family transcriptional regulator